MFVSLHINSSAASLAKGAEIWIPSPGSWYPTFNGVGEDLAQLMLDKFAALGLVDRGTQWDNYEVNGVKKYYPDGSWADSLSVIRNCRASGIMAVLVEHGFISNPSDASYLSSDYNLRQLGLADAESIVSYYELKLPQPLFGFSDVYEDTYHSSEIGWLASSGVSTGFPDGTFRGGAPVARQDMAAFLYRLAGSPAYEPSAADKARFSDVSESTGHAKEIWWLASTGISAGFDDGTFRPRASVARADMAAFMKRYYDKFAVGNQFKDWIPSDKSMLRFTDVDSSTSHAKEIWWLGATGISMGFSDSSFGPLDSVARQDMAAFLHRLDVRADRGENASNFTIMGSSNCTVDQMVGYYNDSKATYPSNVYSSKGAASIADFARIVVEEAEMEGVKAEVVFCQAMKETGWLKFGGSVKPEQCNFAGLGATDSSVSGATFPDVRTGVRAQVQHLKAYASTEPLVNPCVDERFKYVQRGSAPTLTELNGKWAVPGNGYGEGIYSMILILRQSF